jgi:D-alanyl-lipoteichoic acid acyltransferase DltB (MBOAT superfamily)
MIFNSLTFFYFFAAVVLLNMLLPLRCRNGALLAAGFVFYASWNPLYILLLLGTAVLDYLVAIRMGDLPTKAERKPWLLLSLVFSVGSLLFFKYTQMALNTAGWLSSWTSHPWKPPMLDIVLPLGISFYTFETISYGIDVYRGELKPKRSFFEYLSFLFFFPKLIAGPIVRASEFLPQISVPRTCAPVDAQRAMHLLALGFGKKVLFADNFAPFIEGVFSNPLAHNRWACLVAAFGYSMQVYLDFSAYTDIAHGCAKLLGFELPVNFNRPYLAVSFSDFWRRWHISLSRWLRDYLYIPMGGSHGGTLQTYRNLFFTMVIGGLWHGASWTFVIWGMLNGAFLLLERAWQQFRGRPCRHEADMGFWERGARIGVVFCLITFTRIFFRSPSFTTACEMLRAIVLGGTVQGEKEFALMGIPLASFAYVYFSRYRERWLSSDIEGWAVPGYALYLTVLLAFGATRAEFIYFQF